MLGTANKQKNEIPYLFHHYVFINNMGISMAKKENTYLFK